MPAWHNKRQVPYHEKEILDYCVKAGYLVMDTKAKYALEIRSLRKKREQYILFSHNRNFEKYGRVVSRRFKHHV